MLVVPRGAGRRKLQSYMKLKHWLQNSILLLLVLQLLHWLLPFLGLLPSAACSCVPAATDNAKDPFQANLAVGFVCCFSFTFWPNGSWSTPTSSTLCFAVVQGFAQCSTGLASNKQAHLLQQTMHLHNVKARADLLGFCDAFQQQVD